jgi:hypothetical protein
MSADLEVTVLQLSPKIILSVDVGGSLGRAIQASFASTASAPSNSIPPVITSFGMVGSPGQFRIQFAGNSNFTQRVFTSTNMAIPTAGWTPLGYATQISSGFFEFTDLSSTNDLQRFYQLRSP